MKKMFIVYCILFSLTVFHSCLGRYINKNMKKGDEIVQRIEDYKAAHDSLPNKLLDVVQSEYVGEVLFCYEKESDSSYTVWFGTTLGEGMYYYSDSKQWENKLRSMK